MIYEHPDLDKVKHLIYFQDTSTPLKNPEIVDNILHTQILEFVERKINELYIYIYIYIYILYVFYKYEFNWIN